MVLDYGASNGGIHFSLRRVVTEIAQNGTFPRATVIATVTIDSYNQWYSIRLTLSFNLRACLQKSVVV